MTTYSKRAVRDAIRILGYAAQHGAGYFDAERRCGFASHGIHADRVYSLACAARESVGPYVSHRENCAAAENLLRIGWLP